jgi:hypothetical protein
LLAFLEIIFSETTVVKRVSFFVMFALVVFIFIVVAAAIFEKNHYDEKKPAIVLPRLQRRSEPGSPVICTHEGTKVT